MAGREKISSIYISDADRDDVEALRSFRQAKEDKKHSLSHSDLYKAGLGLFTASPDLVKACKLIPSFGFSKPEDVLNYMALALKKSTTYNLADMEPFEKQIRDQSELIKSLSEMVKQQNEIIRGLSGTGLNSSERLEMESQLKEQPTTCSQTQVVESSDKEDIFRTESLESEDLPVTMNRKVPPGMCS